MYAIVKTGGKQYKVAEGDTIFVEKLEAGEGEAVVFDQVLTVVSDGSVKVGRPMVDGAKVTAKVVHTARARRSWSSSTRRSPITASVRVIVSRSRKSLSRRSRRNA